ncbi:Chondroitinase-AC [Armadillidium vulgare]|nr:Chondroitinase-AC [Armadillidium vulgare]
MEKTWTLFCHKYTTIIMEKNSLKNAAAVMWLFDGTQYDLGHDIEEGIFAAFLECQQWLYRATTVEPSTVGRFIDSGSLVTRTGGLDAVKRTLHFLGKVGRHEDEIAAALHRYHNAKPRKEFSLEGNKHFFVSDLMAHQRQGYMVSLRLLSSRTSRPETIQAKGKSKAYYNGNAKGYFKGDGFLTVLVNGRELGIYSREVFQVYDWARIPGVTCHYTKYVPEVSTTTSNKKHNYNEADFVGGVSNGREGIAVMDYARPTVHLKAKKSWFMFDDVIVCLGSGIGIPMHYVNRYPVITTLNQVIYEGLHTVGFNNYEYMEHFNHSVTGKRLTTYGKSVNTWVHHGSVGYVSLVHEKGLGIEIEKRPVYTSGTNPFVTIFSIWLDHGVRPMDAFYAYAILPDQTFKETRTFSSNPTINVLHVENRLHAVCSTKYKIFGVVFFEKGCTNLTSCHFANNKLLEICSDEPILVILKILSQKDVDNESCPKGIETLNKNLKSHFFAREKESSNSVSFYNKRIETNNFVTSRTNNNKTGRTSTDNSVLQMSVSDPTQLLKSLVINLKTQRGDNFLPLSLPLPPKAGSSISSCISIDN